MASTLLLQKNGCEILNLSVFLSSYDLAAVLTSTTGFLSSCKLICFCLKFKAYGLLELLKILFKKKTVDF